MSNILTKAKQRAVERALDTFSKRDTATDIAPDFTCEEAESVHDLLLEFGRTKEAERWLNAHALGDRNPETMHYRRGEQLRAKLVG